ncbi:uncharacterized protein LDX57_009830 [Aspergillus melleus]|uniref:uncharacterized protein n=1 Tax=Aspergillus melleus TaxID=138277 RepID=UPI001E8CBEEA|nr:uncharacterized protein LDX57_009830 [Aspergillus melleus]KAH8432191.1 hypothetical protein LDX57_009830 [Aspergillus melleus]
MTFQRSTPATNFKTKNAKRVPSAPARGNASHQKRRPDEDRLMSALNPTSGQASIREGPAGISIKGASGPFVVIGSNFAPGTTAADIQSTIEPMSGEILKCWVTSHEPTVTAEITFAEKWAADNAIANLHNQRVRILTMTVPPGLKLTSTKADGLILSMRMKPTGASRAKRDLFSRSTGSGSQHSQPSFNDLREQADRERRLHRGADATVQNGNYGFGEQNGDLFAQNDTRSTGRNNRRNFRGRNQGRGGRSTNQDANDQGLYSDEMMVDAPQNSRNRGNWNR